MLVLPASLTHREAPDAVRMLAQTLRGQPAGGSEPVTVDASALKQFDSSALAVLLECQRLSGALGRSLALRHAPPKLRQLARLYGVDGLIDDGPAPARPAQGERGSAETASAPSASAVASSGAG
nr:STAS domain-containing protein [Piscinibacter sakaiensis]